MNARTSFWAGVDAYFVEQLSRVGWVVSQNARGYYEGAHPRFGSIGAPSVKALLEKARIACDVERARRQLARRGAR